MRKPHHDYKLCANSLKEIRRALDDEVLRFRHLEIEATGAAMSMVDLINSVWLWYCQQPEVDRDTIVTVGGEDYWKRLNSDQPLPLVLPDGVAGAPKPSEALGIGGAGGMKPNRRKPKSANLPPLDKD
jgi:hypothetical protein